jgi:DNA primase
VSIPPEVRDEIRARVDLVDLIGAVVPLKRAGERWKGLCPFHQEKTPSFTVNPQRGIFYCFGCHAGGDVFEFLKRHDHLDFLEAVRVLADRTGVALPTREGARPDATARDGLYPLLDWAAHRYQAWLWEGDGGARARRYLAERGLSEEVARAFRLGFAPEGWDTLLGAARQAGHSAEALLGAGLVLPRQTGSGHYDRFRGRLLFPIADTQGRVIAFGGRALAGEEPKYLNSPETPLYQKGQTLYALHLARERMATSRRALLVEGYVDCVMAHQHGVTDTVAVLGTALTPPQLALVRRYADRAVLFFDADRAGMEAARRAEELLERSSAPQWWALERRPDTLARAGLKLAVATLPAGEDPDSFLRKEGRDAFERCCSGARSLLLYALDRVFAEEATETARGRATGVARVALMLAKVQDADEAIELGREAARRLGVDPSDLWLQAQRLGAGAAPAAAAPAAAAAAGTFELDLLQLLVQVPAVRPVLLPLVEPREVVHAPLRAIVVALQAHPALEAEALLARLGSDAERALLARLLLEEPAWPDATAFAQALHQRLERRQQQRQIRDLRDAIARAQAEGTGDMAALQAALTEAARRLRAPAGPARE